MSPRYLILFIFILETQAWSDTKKRKFQDDFMFGVGTTAYRMEGTSNVDGKSECNADENNVEKIGGCSEGTEVWDQNNYYHDVKMLQELGVDYYRFSILWARVLPKGLPYEINQEALEYYENLIDELLKYNIEPMVTLYNYDLPQPLQDLGGWTNTSSVQWFEDYARVVFEKFANKVRYWITVSQPSTTCLGYAGTISGPAIGPGNYVCARNMLVAHAKAYRLYKKIYGALNKGSIGIAVGTDWADSVDNKTENVDATTRLREFNIDFFIEPIFSKHGGFPVFVKNAVATKSKEQDLPESRLPELSASEVNLIKGSADFLGINHYTTYLVKATSKTYPAPSIADDINVELTQRAEWKSSPTRWLKSVPYGLYKICIYINERYNYPPMFITEHGWSTGKGLQDQSRVDNLRQYLSALLLALEDGTKVKGYTAWSLMDIRMAPESKDRFGLYEVDFDSAGKTRTARFSALAYKRIIQKRIVETDWMPKKLKIKKTMKSVKDEL